MAACNLAVRAIGDGTLTSASSTSIMDGFALLNDLARCVMLHVVADRGCSPASASGIVRRPRSRDASRNHTTFHKVSVVPTVNVLNPIDCCAFFCSPRAES
jgi:hypothetical protein